MTRGLLYILTLIFLLGGTSGKLLADESTEGAVISHESSPLDQTSSEGSSLPRPASRNSVKHLLGDNHEAAERNYSEWRSEPGIDLGSKSFTMLQGLLLCVGVLLIGTYIVKRFRTGSTEGSKRRMQVLERLAVSQKTSLLLVEVDGRQIVMAVGAEKVSFSPLQAKADGDKGLELVETKGFETELGKACQKESTTEARLAI